MRKRWYWFLGIERWDGGAQIGLGIATIHWFDGGTNAKRVCFWWNRD